MSTEIVARLKALKLHGMAANWPELVARCRHSALGPEALVEQLLSAEGAERELRSISYQMKAARFPAQVPRPPHWSGWFVTPRVIEFWLQRDHRLHERTRFIRSGAGWRHEIVYP